VKKLTRERRLGIKGPEKGDGKKKKEGRQQDLIGGCLVETWCLWRRTKEIMGGKKQSKQVLWTCFQRGGGPFRKETAKRIRNR